jgi:ribosomal protein L11 methylase PrmA
MKVSAVHPDPGSFRDPAGQVFIAEDRVYRTVSPDSLADVERVLAAGVLKRLAADGRMVATEVSSDSAIAAFLRGAGEREIARVLSHPRLTPVTYPYEWSFEGLKSAALAHLQLQLDLLDQGFTLSDASAFNMQFDGPRPIHIDVLSIVTYNDGDRWLGYGQFMREFFNPLVLEAETGVSFAPWYRGALGGITNDELTRLLPKIRWLRPAYLMHIVLPALYDRRATRADRGARAKLLPLPKARLRNLLSHLHHTISALRSPRNRTTPWLDYAAANTYAGAERDAKRRGVAAFVAAVRPQMLLDIGCNTGEYAAVALEAGARRVIGLESDRAALDAAFRRAADERLAFLPLAVDLVNPSPAQGWRGKERGAFVDRLSADALLALAVLHHVVIRNNIPLADAVRLLVSLAPRGLIEFVPKSDPQVERLLRYRRDIFVDYDVANFRALLERDANVVEKTRLTDSGRTLFRYER